MRAASDLRVDGIVLAPTDAARALRRALAAGGPVVTEHDLTRLFADAAAHVNRHYEGSRRLLNTLAQACALVSTEPSLERRSGAGGQDPAPHSEGSSAFHQVRRRTT